MRLRHPSLKWLAIPVLLMGAAAGWLLYRAVPAEVRALPAGDTLLYMDLQPLHPSGWLALGGNIQPAPAYAAFVKDSGFEFLRDLDRLAISLRGSPVQSDSTTAELAGNFPAKFQAYLGAHAQRRLALSDAVGYQFPGWSRPDRPITVIPLGPRRLLVTNSVHPQAVLRQAQAFHPFAPPLWRRPVWSLPPLGYFAMDVLHLAAQQRLDGSRPPFRNAQRLQASLDAHPDLSIELRGTLATASPADAAQAAVWLQAQIQQLQPLLPEASANTPTLRALLDRLQVTQSGPKVHVTLRLGPATLARWQQSLSRGQ